ncbi:MAG: UDP-glucose 4-epimerase [Zetaproteobacteria bacterium CG06_land_8_20_14_3_00_59_53]|nr:MAG: UDP-glucose 4-epimerase [Zetaproteobacteria bacterium CG23_combo_of_CG06-09_8_20_14_all_59_86]PIQ64400.1 MAG: UDP-glucose 4-epimerase [Zetaproteobacteria bacterium CG11_big_fil_rev_8_21_14_0_20_59_439]PIU70483.1 MAG: UDP-glucose 4-epimerase [Zetaproteobacteria bacterium CG06_land_8_20_14_3_00_59_53]PIU97523.1 MAG: UDP-glucose 4-epimerase [Zetaproteobacteria bacterium CG03_land_8_20_14_0_80_59_51]PIY46678.1 MAG: UDP-glucose 4-epimerase [Zetaproteobacteria bacterium CG_4_10_14_0_8_um_filt
MKLLITGGFGYLGGRLAEYLARLPHYGLVLGTRHQTGLPLWASSSSVVQTIWDSPHELRRICDGIDAVIHLAGMNAQDCAKDPDGAVEVNALHTARLLRAAIQQGVSRFIYLSTAHVYASPLTGLVTEQDCPRNLHPYATSHRAGEDVVRAASQRGEIEGVVIRLSNSFGAPMNGEVNCWMLLVNDLCRQAVQTQRLVLRTSGLQSRDFITLTDACRAIGHLLLLPSEKLGDGLFNVGGETMTVVDMAEMIQKRCVATLGFSPEIIRHEATSGEVNLNLEYRKDKLLSSGFVFDGDAAGEIDSTLCMCHVERRG